MECSDRVLLTAARIAVAVKAWIETNPATTNQVHFTDKYSQSSQTYSESESEIQVNTQGKSLENKR
jgi:hypothetical protein